MVRKNKYALQVVVIVLIVVFAVYFPKVVSPRWMHIAVLCCYYLLMAQSWNLLMGFTGLFSFAHPALAALGGYTSALLFIYLGVHPLLGMVLGGLFAATMSLLLGLVSLRLHGFYLCLVTWAFLEIFVNIVRINHTFTGGTMGLTTPPMFDRSLGRLPYFYLGLFMVICLNLFIIKLMDSRAGLYLKSIRDDDVASQVMGVNPTLWKLLAFTISGFWAGMAGSYYVHALRVVEPGMASLGEMGQIVLMVVIGGIGTIAGPVIGGILVVLSSQLLMGQFAELSLLIFAVLMILVMRFVPGGIIGFVMGPLNRVPWKKGSISETGI